METPPRGTQSTGQCTPSELLAVTPRVTVALRCLLTATLCVTSVLSVSCRRPPVTAEDAQC